MSSAPLSGIFGIKVPRSMSVEIAIEDEHPEERKKKKKKIENKKWFAKNLEKKECRNILDDSQFLVSLNRRLTMSLDRSNFSADKEATFDNDPDPAYPRSRKRYGIAIFFSFFLNKILPENSAERERERNLEEL